MHPRRTTISSSGEWRLHRFREHPSLTGTCCRHFTLRGPPAPSPYAAGIYHGRIVLPATYPLKPPNFRFLTPTGRFEVNREICLSISGHHEETWQPAWGIRTALVAIRSFMDSDAKGQVGGLECDRQARERMAQESTAWQCATCGKTNKQLLQDREEEASEDANEDTVPDELRLAYRDELEKPSSSVPPHTAQQPPAPAPASTAPPPAPALTPTPTQPAAAPPLPVRRGAVVQQQTPDRSLQWIDTCIYGIVAALLFLVLKKFAS